MSKFYGSITGSAKTAATRCGTKNSGIESHTRGWHQGVYVNGYEVERVGINNPECVERFDIYLTGGSADPSRGAYASNDKYIGSLEDGKWIPAKTEGGTQ
tara:strand:- start:1754 stop:2053 length:300 start_codon:yes stop_codon:yes gene_type:complete